MGIIIVGGGVIGATLAIAISRFTAGGLFVYLVEETAPYNADYLERDSRAIAISYGTCQQLKRVGVWQVISHFATPIRSIHVSDRGHFGFVTLEARDYWINSLGQVIKLYDITSSLFDLLQKLPGIVLHCPSRAIDFTRNDAVVSVTLNSGKILKGQLLIAADGFCSPFSAKCGIMFQKELYDQVALITEITTSINHDGRAWERFTKYGPLAMLPAPQGKYSLIWCHTKKKLNDTMALSDDQFCDKLQKYFGWRLGRIQHVGSRISYPLIASNANNLISHRVVLVGNAAQTLHPVAGQGFNLGIRNIMSLAEILATSWSRRQDCGAYSVLAHYRRCCQLDRSASINITDGLVRLFTNDWIPLVIGRNLGMVAIELFSPIRNLLAQQALGLINRREKNAKC